MIFFSKRCRDAETRNQFHSFIIFISGSSQRYKYKRFRDHFVSIVACVVYVYAQYQLNEVAFFLFSLISINAISPFELQP